MSGMYSSRTGGISSRVGTTSVLVLRAGGFCGFLGWRTTVSFGLLPNKLLRKPMLHLTKNGGLGDGEESLGRFIKLTCVLMQIFHQFLNRPQRTVVGV